jgi:hypothetical protein
MQTQKMYVWKLQIQNYIFCLSLFEKIRLTQIKSAIWTIIYTEDKTLNYCNSLQSVQWNESLYNRLKHFLFNGWTEYTTNITKMTVYSRLSICFIKKAKKTTIFIYSKYPVTRDHVHKRDFSGIHQTCWWWT